MFAIRHIQTNQFLTVLHYDGDDDSYPMEELVTTDDPTDPVYCVQDRLWAECVRVFGKDTNGTIEHGFEPEHLVVVSFIENAEEADFEPVTAESVWNARREASDERVRQMHDAHAARYGEPRWNPHDAYRHLSERRKRLNNTNG